jgi:hypothetical protein
VIKRLFGFLSKYWWLLAIGCIAALFFTKSHIFTYVILIFAIPFLILFFLPFIIQLFAPAIFLFSTLVNHFKESKNMPQGKKYIFIPMAILAAVVFILAQTVLSIWIFVISFMIWANVIGTFFAIVLIFFFGLAPLAILTAPFAIWIKEGTSAFFNISAFFLMALFWYGLSKLAFSKDYSSTPEDYLGYSPQTFLLGALSTQVIALPFYNFNVFRVGLIISEVGGIIFLLLTIISAIKWFLIKKKLNREEKLSLYKPSVWAYILGFLITDFLYWIFSAYQVNTAVLTWLNLFFILALIGRFVDYIRKRIASPEAS